MFLAYKGVTSNMTDAHTGTVDNSIGVTNELPRNKISDDPNKDCHFGFHVGALDYAKTFSNRVIICKVDPADVVCVPYDCSQQKMRVCKYKVIGHWNGQPMSSTTIDPGDYGEEPLRKTIYVGPGATLAVEATDSPKPSMELNALEQEMVKGGNWIGAIKEIRIRLNLGLKEARDLVEAWRAANTEKKLIADAAEAVEKIPADELEEKRVGGKGWLKFDKLDFAGLMEQSLDDLRQYAGKGLKIVGASKVAGGKATLVARILEVRK